MIRRRAFRTHVDAETNSENRASYWLEAERSVAAGELVHALDVLMEANRAAPTTVREQRLVELRRLAFDQLTQRGRPSWPPELADPFPDSELPEVGADELSVPLVGGGILHHGAVLVRGLIEPAGVARLIECIDRALDGAAATRYGTYGEEHAPWYRPFGPTGMGLGEGKEWVRVIDSPRAAFEVADQLQRVNHTFLTGYLGERPAMGSYKWTLRRITPECVGEWHQDGRFLGAGIRVANVWIALTRCGGGEDAAGLEVVPRRLDRFLASGTAGATLDFTIPCEVVEQSAGGNIADPVYEPGDALVFDERTAHRTGSRQGLTSTRYAIEAWFFAPSAYPENQMGFVF